MSVEPSAVVLEVAQLADAETCVPHEEQGPGVRIVGSRETLLELAIGVSDQWTRQVMREFGNVRCANELVGYGSHAPALVHPAEVRASCHEGQETSARGEAEVVELVKPRRDVSSHELLGLEVMLGEPTIEMAQRGCADIARSPAMGWGQGGEELCGEPWQRCRWCALATKLSRAGSACS